MSTKTTAEGFNSGKGLIAAVGAQPLLPGGVWSGTGQGGIPARPPPWDGATASTGAVFPEAGAGLPAGTWCGTSPLPQAATERH